MSCWKAPAISTASMPPANWRSIRARRRSNQLTAVIAPFAPALRRAAQCARNESGPRAGKTHARSRQDRRTGRSCQCARRCRFRCAAAQGHATITAKPSVAAIRGIDLDALRRSDIGLEAKISSEQGASLIALLGLDRVIAAGDGPAQFEGSVSRHMARAAAPEGEDIGARASMPMPRARRSRGRQEPKASFNLRIRSADIATAAGSQAVRRAGARISPVVARLRSPAAS